MVIELAENLKITEVTQEQTIKIKKLLSFPNPAYEDAVKFKRSTWRIRKSIKLYKEYNKYIAAPRGSLYKLLFFLGAPEKIIDSTAYFNKIDIPSRIELKKLQKSWVSNMLTHTQGIGVAPAGSGKTVSALYMIGYLGQPTLWLTHRKSLMEQFKERAGFFIDAGRIGTIGMGKMDLGDIITVGMIQTIAKKEIQDLKNKFGLVIVDEAHIVPTKQTIKSISQFAPRYLYGLTATPFREDRLEQVIFDTIGPIVSIMDRDEVVKAKNILPATIQIRDTKVQNLHNPMAAFAEIIEYLVHHEKRNNLIVGDILAEIALGNICIALTSRIEHGAIIKDILQQYGVVCGHVHSELPYKQRQAEMSKFIEGKIPLLIATYQLLSEGFDHQPASRIFFMLPYKAKGLIEQSKGRIERVYKDKIDAIVYDYVDFSIKMLYNQYEARIEQYNEHNLVILEK